MSKTKGGGSTRNGRDSNAQRLGVKVFDGTAITAGLPSGPDDALMRILYEFDVLAGNSALHDELVQKMYLRQLDTYRGIFAAGRRTGVFTPNLDDGQLAMTFVALEDAYGLHIVAGNALMTVESAAATMRAVAAELGCPPAD